MKSIPLLVSFAVLAGTLPSAGDEGDFRVTERLFVDELGSRLVVRPDVRANTRAADLELRVFDETYYDPDLFAFTEREVATIQGGGLGSPGLRFVTGDPRAREEFIQVLEEFSRRAEIFRENRAEFAELEEPWMGNESEALERSAKIATIHTDFLRRPAAVTVHWDVARERFWLSLDGFINVDSRIADPLRRLVEGIPSYSEQRARYEAEIERKKTEIGTTLEVPAPADP
jgi:hypothetical protein